MTRAPSASDSPPHRAGRFGLPVMRHENACVWLVFVSALDVVLTRLILSVGTGSIDAQNEINPLARLVIEEWGILGASLFKFSLVTIVIVITEVVSRLRPRTGMFLVWTSVAIGAFPVVWSLTLLIVHRFVDGNDLSSIFW